MTTGDTWRSEYWALHCARWQHPHKQRLVDKVRELIEIQSASGIVSVADVGVGHGVLLKTLLERLPNVSMTMVGVDVDSNVLTRASRLVPSARYFQGDLLDPSINLPASASPFVCLAVNVLHEVYSCGRHSSLSSEEEVAHETGVSCVRAALGLLVRWLRPGGTLLIMDGVFPSGDLGAGITLEARSLSEAERMRIFERTYRAAPLAWSRVATHRVATDIRTLIRYCTKRDFILTPAWKVESGECYQYWCVDEFEEACISHGLIVEDLELMMLPLPESELGVEELVGNELPERIMLVARKPAA